MFCHMCWRLPQTDTETQFLIQAPPRQSDVRVGKKLVPCLIKLRNEPNRTPTIISYLAY
jgi:hypothetical protein